jgi:hypothetical protein
LWVDCLAAEERIRDEKATEYQHSDYGNFLRKKTIVFFDDFGNGVQSNISEILLYRLNAGLISALTTNATDWDNLQEPRLESRLSAGVVSITTGPDMR